MNLTRRIQQGESETLEFKRSFDKKAIETVCAFANAKGCWVFIGITDDAEIKGLTVNKEMQQDYISQIKTQTEPGLVLDIEANELIGKIILLIKVGEFPIKSISFKGQFYQYLESKNGGVTDGVKKIFEDIQVNIGLRTTQISE